MSLQKLDIYNVRNINRQTILPGSTLNFIFGKNGSGKSAFVEAIYLLGRGKSFRTSSISTAIRFNQPELIVTADLKQSSDQLTHLGIKLDGRTVKIHRDQQSSLKRSDLAYALPLILIHPKSYELLDSGSQFRREFIDWGAFHHEPDFLKTWKKYKKALAQRNALLKLRSLNQLQVWTQELATYGTIVQQCRFNYIEQFKPVFFDILGCFLSQSNFNLTLFSGWEENYSLFDSIEKDLEKDVKDGFTHSGPHRGDLLVMLGDDLAKNVVSRGQLKVLVVCFKLAQIQLYFNHYGRFGCILIDDFAAELDLENRGKILNFLEKLNCQVFITATERSEFGDLSSFNHKMFHVEHGKFNEI